MFRNRSVDVHQFAMVPRADIPRSSFRMQTAHKTTFDAGLLIPVYVDEVLPGDTFNLRMTIFARLSTPLFPVMDNLYLDSFFFFVPNRLLWTNWKKFMGEQDNPGDSISFNVPFIQSAAGGFEALSIYDYLGLPTVGQVDPAGTAVVNALPLRAYNLIYNEWFRDENLQNSIPKNVGDGPDSVAHYVLRRRGKRHDYFTSCLPFPQKGQSVALPLGTEAPVMSTGQTIHLGGSVLTSPAPTVWGTYTGNAARAVTGTSIPSGEGVTFGAKGAAGVQTGLYADLSAATSATINQLRQAFQIQKLLERDARGGTRYTEIVRAHFGVISPDARLQRPEYLGGSSSPVTITPVAQTQATQDTLDTPQGHLAGIGTLLGRGHGFVQSFTEHGYILGLVCVRADLTYQQGLRRMWNRSTRYDFYFPAFATLGEQSVFNREIYFQGKPGIPGTFVGDNDVFGYQERWAEYRYHPSMITGLFRSTHPATIDPWHLAQHFTALPVLGATFIEERPPVDRVVAIGAAAAGQQFIADMFFDIKAARPMPMYSVPGLIDHF